MNDFIWLLLTGFAGLIAGGLLWKCSVGDIIKRIRKNEVFSFNTSIYYFRL